MARIKPCPFCGAPGKLLKKREVFQCDGEECYDIHCGTPGCYLESGADLWLNRLDALVLWNTRPVEQKQYKRNAGEPHTAQRPAKGNEPEAGRTGSSVTNHSPAERRNNTCENGRRRGGTRSGHEA